jgi:hypothetical protein
MPNRKHQMVTLPPVPREGQLVLLGAVEGLLGRHTEVGRCLTRAIASQELRDFLQAEAAFDALSAEQREHIADEVRLILEHDSEWSEASEFDNVVRLRPRAAGAPRVS